MIGQAVHMPDYMNDILSRCFALTGGIATGKSTVAKMLAEKGCHIVDTDLIAREVVEPGTPGLTEIAEKFGAGVLNGDGTLDREAMRQLIIHDPEKREVLNGITHPRINEIVFNQIKKHYAKDSLPIIIDVPLLFEAGWHTIFGTVILVYVPVAVQVERLMARDGLARQMAEKTLTFQMGIEEKRKLATYVIDNSGTLDATSRQVEELFGKLNPAKA
ncbi:MAG TPA: dephospho-CoA kinase [Spirochaetota bacterium]|nr:dephospho-CoA kinase [Spirochaetota bacterium]